jgi:splicing factor 45
MSGDEAYERRLAMSANMRAVSPPAAAINTTQIIDGEDFIPGLANTAVPPPTETGDEAYLRRVALSQAQARRPISPVFSEPVTEVSPSLAYNPFAPPPAPPPPGPPGTLTIDALEDKVKAAAAIAARLGALAATATATAGTPAGSASPAPPVAHDENEVTSKRYGQLLSSISSFY